MGSCTAYALACRGQRALLLEQFSFLHRRGSSHGESRIIRKTYPESYHSAMMKEAYTLWEQAEHEAGYKVITKTGGLDVSRKGYGDLEGVKAACAMNDIECQLLTPAEVAERYPGVQLPDDYEAVYSSEGGVVNATKACAMFQELARARGATLQDETEVIKVDESPDGVTVTCRNGREYRCRQVIICPGAWCSKLCAKLLGITVRTTVWKTTVAYWRTPLTSFEAARAFPVFINYGEPDIYGLPVLELPGLLKMCLHGGPEVDPDTRDFAPDREGIAVVSDYLARVMPSCGKEPELAETCMYTMTDDHHFILDLAPGSRRIVIGGGFSGHGFKMAPLIGAILTDLALEGRTEIVSEMRGIDLQPFRIERVLGARL